MLEFAVQIQGDSKGRWVLAVDAVGERFLIANDDKSLQWVDMTRCHLLKAKNPELPLPVVMVHPPTAQDQLVVPQMQMKGGPNGNHR